jgi:hypothetical protein
LTEQVQVDDVEGDEVRVEQQSRLHGIPYLKQFSIFFLKIIFNPNPHCLWIKRSFFIKKREKVLDDLAKYFFSFQKSLHKNAIFNKLFMILFTFLLSKSSGLKRKRTPLPPPPHTALCRGWGSSGSFQPGTVSFVMAVKQ